MYPLPEFVITISLIEPFASTDAVAIASMDAPPPKTGVYSQQGSDVMRGRWNEEIYTRGLSLTLFTFSYYHGKSM